MREKPNKINRFLAIFTPLLRRRKNNEPLRTSRPARYFECFRELFRVALRDFCKVTDLHDRDLGRVDMFSHGGQDFFWA